MVLLMLSPLATLALLGAIYVAARTLNGLELAEAVNSFKAIIYSLIHNYSYLTILPAALVFPFLIVKNRNKIKNPNK